MLTVGIVVVVVQAVGENRTIEQFGAGTPEPHYNYCQEVAGDRLVRTNQSSTIEEEMNDDLLLASACVRLSVETEVWHDVPV